MIKVNLYLDGTVWRMFRIACLEQGMSASKAVERLIREQLQVWSSEQRSQGHA